MSRTNLIAYIPTLNQRHLEWFGRHPGSDLFLISQTEAENLLPRLARNMAALPTEMVARMISLEGLVRQVRVFFLGWEDCDLDLSSSVWQTWILPDEDISHIFAKKYLTLETGND